MHKISNRDGTTVLVTTHYMDEAEKCTDLAYISLGKLLYSGPTNQLVPFSDVKTYRVSGAEDALYRLNDVIQSDYPGLLVLLNNNDWRVSSRHHDVLARFASEKTHYQLASVTPSFEEVFIGLMQ